MKLELARDVARAGFRSASELSGLLKLLQRSLPNDEYIKYRTAIATAIHTVMANTVDRAIGEHPSLYSEIDEEIEQHGRYR